MQPISQNPYPIERWSDIRVIFELIDTDAAEDATPTATSETDISKLEQTHNRVYEMNNRIATLEPNYFLLDGSFILPQETNNGEVGWWSNEISDVDGNLLIPQVLEFTFTEEHSSIGFTIIFDNKANEYASDFIIQVYDGQNELLKEDIVKGNTLSTYVSNMPVENYKKVKIIFQKTAKPFRRVRVCEVVFGVIQTFDKSNTKEMNILYELSPIAEYLPINELKITIDNSDRKYNMLNPNGIYKYLQQGQALDVKMGVGDSQNNIEMINMGKFYYTESETEDDSLTAKITAKDMFYELDNGTCRIGTTGTWTVNEAVNAVIADSGLDIITKIPTNIGNRVINKCIPQNSTHREALRLIAQAAMCTCFFNRNDELEFAEILVTENPLDILNNDNMYKPARVSDLGRINKIELTVKDEYANTEIIYIATNKNVDETDKVKSISNPLVYDGQNVANWLLSMYQMRSKYELQERGNPAREIGDTIKIYDVYNENWNAVVIKEEYTFDGALQATTEARGGMI